jgi:photosystem II stability/assembly factor-like uncharacterized protein
MPYSDKDEQMALERGFSVAQLRQLQMEKGSSNRELAELSEGKIRSALRSLETPDRPHARQAFLRMQQIDESGTIAPNALMNALRQLDHFRHRAAAKPRVAGVPCGETVVPRMLAPPPPPRGAGISTPAQWVAIGPGNIGGRTRAIVVHPTNPDTIWIASVGGGIWRSDDGGQDWSPVDDMMANLAVSCMVMDPINPNIIYAGTGEGFFNLDAIRGAGIFRTTDGVTWSQIGSTANPSFFWVNRLAISCDGVVLLAATREGIFRSADQPRMSWEHVLNNFRIADVRFHPSDPERAVAGSQDGSAHFTTDGGKTWTQATHSGIWGGRVEVTYAAHNPNIVYASVQMDTGKIWRSTDGGQTYAERNSNNEDGVPANYLGAQGWYDNTIWAGDTANADFLIVGGIDLWKSNDGGHTLKRISLWSDPASVHADHHAIVSHPNFGQGDNRTVFFGNDGGIYRADDVFAAGDPNPTQGWTNLVSGYDVTQFYAGAGHSDSGTIVGGAQDNGSLGFAPDAGANAWTEFFGGDGGFVASDPGDAQIFYGEYVSMEIFRNTNGAVNSDQWWMNYITGRFWNSAIGAWDWKPLPFTVPEVRNGQALFIAPFILDPNESNRLLGGARSLWRTNDAKTPNTNTSGPSWEAIKAGNVGSRISAICLAKGNSDLIWVGYENGQIHRTINGTAANPSWQRIDSVGAGSISIARYCTRIVIDPADHNTVFVMFGGYRDTNLWKTTDAAATWHSLGQLLPESPVRALAIHPSNRDFLYVGTEVGVFSSEDGGATWSPTNEGPTNCAVYDLFWMGEVLVCVTHGRGMFTIDLSGV